MGRKWGVKLTKEKKEEFLKIAEKNYGLLNDARLNSGVSRYHFDMWMHNDPIFRAAVDDLPNKTVKKVESKLFKLIEQSDKTAIIFYLKCKGGYIETQHIKQETTFTQPLTINVIAPTIEPLKIEGEEQKKLKE